MDEIEGNRNAWEGLFDEAWARTHTGERVSDEDSRALDEWEAEFYPCLCHSR